MDRGAGHPIPRTVIRFLFLFLSRYVRGPFILFLWRGARRSRESRSAQISWKWRALADCPLRTSGQGDRHENGTASVRDRESLSRIRFDGPHNAPSGLASRPCEPHLRGRDGVPPRNSPCGSHISPDRGFRQGCAVPILTTDRMCPAGGEGSTIRGLKVGPRPAVPRAALPAVQTSDGRERGTRGDPPWMAAGRHGYEGGGARSVLGPSPPRLRMDREAARAGGGRRGGRM